MCPSCYTALNKVSTIKSLTQHSPLSQHTWYFLAIKCLDDLFALLFGLHAGKAHAPAVALVVSQDARGDDLPKRGKHLLQIGLCHVQRQVGNVQVGRVLFLLLWSHKHTNTGDKYRAVGMATRCMAEEGEIFTS